MVQVEFNFEQRVTMIQAELNDSFKNIITKFANKSNLDINKLYYIFHGNPLDINEIIGNKMNESEKEKKKFQY